MKKDNPLSLLEVRELIHQTQESFRHQECETCECYLGYITQLEVDSSPEAREFLTRHQTSRDQIHACLGCDPCPPGILYSNYLRKKRP